MSAVTYVPVSEPGGGTAEPRTGGDALSLTGATVAFCGEMAEHQHSLARLILSDSFFESGSIKLHRDNIKHFAAVLHGHPEWDDVCSVQSNSPRKKITLDIECDLNDTAAFYV